MQIIYIDTLICVNLFIDYIILYTEKNILHINTKHIRLLLGALFGSLTTLVVLLPFYNTLFSIFYRFLTALIIVFISFGVGTFRKLLIRSAAYFGISMLLCGGILLIELLINPQGVAIYNDTIYFDISPVTLLCSTIAVYLGITIYQKISKSHKLNCEIRRVTIHTNEKDNISFESAIDTGCSLIEPFSGLPVILAEREIFSNISVPKEKMRVIPVDTVAGKDIIVGFRPKKVLIDNVTVHGGCYIGICDNKLSGEIKSIMGTDLSEAI